MAQTKIKGHRIGEGEIKLPHLNKDLKVPESMLNLRYPTHSSAGDLSPSQKFTLTQGGNADGLHFHNGGGGGPAGIYTNEERDAQLLKLSMMVNAGQFGLDKAIKENFKDDATIDYGIPPANAPSLTLVPNDPVYGGDLEADKDYSYGVSIKNKYGQTTVVNTASIHTSPNYTDQAVRLSIANIPTDNEGVEVYRADSLVDRYLADNEKSKWSNDACAQVEYNAPGGTVHKDSIHIGHVGNTHSASDLLSRQEYVDMDCGQTGYLQSLGVNIRTTISTDVPFEYYVHVDTNDVAHTVEIIWHYNPTYVPQDYEIYFTRRNTVDETTVWEKFQGLSPVKDFNGVVLNDGTDGDIIDECRIVNNTKSQNRFRINRVDGVKIIKIVVTRVHSLCYLEAVRLSKTRCQAEQTVFMNLSGVNLAPYKSITMDTKMFTSGYYFAELIPQTENVAASTSIYSQSLTSGQTDFRDQVIRSIVNSNRNTTTYNYVEYNRVRIAFNLYGQDTRIENMYISFYHPDAGNANAAYNKSQYMIPEMTVPITFNGGKHYLESTGSGLVWSDWCYLPSVSRSVQCISLTFRGVRGRLGYYNGGTYEFTQISSAGNYQGYESLNYDISGNNSNYSYFNIQLGKAQNIEHQLGWGCDRSKWNNDTFDIESVSALRGIRIIPYYQGTTYDTKIAISNINARRTKNLLNGTVACTYELTTGASTSQSQKGQYLGSKSRSISFNQYASITAPQVACIKFNTPQLINKISFNGNSSSRTPRNYILQYAVSSTAKFDDDLSSQDWFNFQNVTIGDPGIDVGFTGSITESDIRANNVYNRYVTHNFDNVECLKVRMYITSTVGGGLPYMYDIMIMSAEETADMKLVWQSEGKVQHTEIDVLDTNTYSGDEKFPPKVDTTGSHNIIWHNYYEKVTKHIKNEEAILYLRNIPLSLYEDFMLCSQQVGTLKFEASFDNGYTFDLVTPDIVHSLENQVDQVTLKITFITEDAELHALAMLYSL